MEKILVIRLSSIGDVILCSPAIRCIHQQMDAELHVLSKKGYASLWAGSPYIHKTWIYEEELESDFSGLKETGFDRIFDMHVNWRTWKVCRVLGVERLTFDKLNVNKWLMVNFKIDQLPRKHLVDRYFEALNSWGVKNDGLGLDYFNLEAGPSDLPDKFVSLVLGAAHATKMIPEEKLNSIIAQSTMPIVLLGGPGERELGDRIASSARSEVINLAGRTNVAQSADVISRSHHVISPDTGMMHIAAALQKPLTVLWGNTIPEFGMFPYYGLHSNRSWQSHEIQMSCRPCSKIGFGKCPKGHFDCMMMQDASRIWDLIS